VAQKFEFQITAKDFKKRLDEFLFAEFPHLSRLYLRELVRDEKCEVNGRWENRGHLLKINDFIEIEVDDARQTSLQPEPIPLEIIFEDAEFLVVNKRAGMLVHPTVGVRTGTLLNALAHYLNLPEEEKRSKGDEQKNKFSDKNVLTFDEEVIENSRQISASPHLPLSPAAFVRAGLVHRLDKDTSGLVVIAKNTRSHRILCSHFQRKLVEKRYFALVEGIVREDAGTIDAPIGRFAEERIWNIKDDGKRAVSRFWVKERFNDKTLLELEPVTGRTNQLRIHLAHLGHPIVGDTKYGGREFQRLCLHAFRLNFWHPNGNERLNFETNLPGSFRIRNFKVEISN
jgi:23S rRNA pseudouridine1911/1915/1917 synthase